MKINNTATLGAFFVAIIFTSPANGAVATIPTTGVALASMTVAAASATSGGVVANNAINNKSTGGLILGGIFGIGALGLALVDPPAATFYDGTFVLHYDSSLMKTSDSGWFGSWGEDSTLLPPPTDTSQWGSAGIEVVLQNPNSALTASVSDDSQNGLQTVSFNWGASGHPETTGPFNFFGTLFEFTKNVEITFLENATQAPSEANFFVTTNGFACTLPGDDLIQLCGEPTTSYYKVTEVPEPAIFWLMLSGVGLLAFSARRSPRKTH